MAHTCIVWAVYFRSLLCGKINLEQVFLNDIAMYSVMCSINFSLILTNLPVPAAENIPRAANPALQCRNELAR